MDTPASGWKLASSGKPVRRVGDRFYAYRAACKGEARLVVRERCSEVAPVLMGSSGPVQEESHCRNSFWPHSQSLSAGCLHPFRQCEGRR